ncbi:arginine methyl transferase [Gautieria morchelliformis]|nr:arginine methyl transferase [Gautieria morchelliformis]
MDDDGDSEVDTAIRLGSHLINTIFSSLPSDIPVIQSLVKAGAPLWYQDEAHGFSALHAACFVENPEMVQILIENGAVWNSVDELGNTAGDIALSLNDEASYRIIRDAGIRSEYLLQVLSSKSGSPSAVVRSPDDGPFSSTEAFLDSKLFFSHDAHGQEICSVVYGNETVGVMMGWERPIMQSTVHKLCQTHLPRTSGLRILNVGFGLGLVDTLFQALDPPPSQHMIIEPHRDVLTHMHRRGWHDRPGVTILEGRWQDFVESGDIYGEGGWDVVYADTFAEGYEELKNFFDIVPDLLSGPEAQFSFFNGLGATNALFYDVYTQLSELHLKDAGVDIEWTDVDVEDDVAENRWGGTREYFKVRLYRLPVGKMIHI